MSDMPILLVEGPGDAEFFDCLRKALDLNAGNVRIDDADFKIPGRENNRRGNVEYVAKEIVGNHKYQRVAKRFIGFADREFDDFDFEQSPIIDYIGVQRQDGRLIYSRGHSIENYVFDYDLIIDALEEHYPNTVNERTMALNNMREFFDQILCIACAISSSAYKNELIGAINELLYHINEWDSEKAIMSYDQTKQSVALNWDEFRIRLLEYRDEHRADAFIGSYEHYLDVISRAGNQETARWLCHGHIGVHIIRLAYAMFIYHSFTSASPGNNPPLSEISDMLTDTKHLPLRGHKTARRLRGRSESSSWVQHYCNHIDKDTSPAYCFAALGVLP